MIYLSNYLWICIAHTGHAPCFNLDPKRHEKRLLVSGVNKVSKSRCCISFAPLGIVFIPPPRIKHVPWVEGIVSTEKHDKK